MEKILIVSDAWTPQVNGVVRTLQKTIKHLYVRGYDVQIVHPGMFKTVSLPLYPEIQIAQKFKKELRSAILDDPKLRYIHIPVELGPLGRYARRVCVKEGLKFTSAYHTMFPEYVQSMLHIPFSKQLVYKFMKDFHNDSACVMVATKALKHILEQEGFDNLALWERGVDTILFSPQRATTIHKEYALFVGRVSVEKNIKAFCELDLTKHNLWKRVVGDGPQLEQLKKEYPHIEFVGAKRGEELAAEYANAAVFVFPSRTDTFGLVMIEALASGVPVAAFDEPNTRSILNNDVGAIDNDLELAVEKALQLDRRTCRSYAVNNYTWEKCTQQFISNLVPIR